MRNRTLALSLLSLLSIIPAVACSDTAAEEEPETALAEVNELKSLWADAKRLDLSDLTRTTVGFATEGLNDALSSGPNGLRFDPPQVFAASAQQNRVLPDQYEIKALDSVVSGLAARFGEKELGTEVNAIRLRHLQQSNDNFYVESAFSVRAGIDHDWSFNSNGFADTGISIGIDAGAELVSRLIVAAPDDKVSNLVSAPLQAAKNMRGFVYPRTVADVRSMKPGEMFALRGVGKLGGNFGVGVPVLVANPTGPLTYQILVSAGVSGVIGGQLDVQLVRLDGDEVVVDVGVENGRGVSFHAGISDSWGVKGICDDGQKCLRDVDLGVTRINLARLVEKAVEKRLNNYLSFRIEGQASNASSRVSLSRFRFHLDKGNPDEVEKALQQTLKFDIRLAQAMYNRDLGEREQAVTTELDAVRASTTSTRSFGFELLGMNIYHNAVVKKQGSFVVQTPEGAKSILFDQVHRDGGWFQMDHGYTRTGIAAQTLDARNSDSFRSEANLFVQTAVGDKNMDDDFMIDAVDATILGLAGKDAIDTLDKFGNDMQRLVWQTCPAEVQADNDGPRGSNTASRRFNEECNVRLLDDARMIGLKRDGLAAIERNIADLPNDYKTLVREAANVRLTLQSVGIHNFDALNGPNASFTIDMRFDDKALDILSKKSKAEYAGALREYLGAIHADRMKVGTELDKNAVLRQVDDKWGRDIEKMASKFEARAHEYKLIADAERLIPTTLNGKKFVSYPLGVRFTVDRNEAKTYESAIIDSTSHDRAKAAAKLFDDLFSEADRINAPMYDEHTAAYPLLSLVPHQNVEVGMMVRADVRSTFWAKRERFLKAGFKSISAHARGAEVSTISGDMFNLDTIINAQ